MKTILFLFMIVGFGSATGCVNAQSTPPEKILIVYLSRTGNTKAVAEIIRQNVGGKLVELELQTPYPENYKAAVDQVAKENETGYLPPPVKSFLRQYNLAGKTVVPFNTNAGYGVGSGFETVSEMCAASNVLNGFELKGGAERDGVYLSIKGEKRKEAETKIREWLQKLNLIE